MLGKWLVALLIATLPISLAADFTQTELPSIGDSAGVLISPEQEKLLGEAMMRHFRQRAPLVRDPELNDYIQHLGYELASSSDSPGYGFTFFLVRDPSINAFAGPGGYIGVHTGLVLAAQDEAELAGVLAHEIAHVTQRHLVRAYEAANKMTLPAAAALLAAIVVGTQNPEAGAATLMGAQAAAAQYQINFTRANEYEADRVGIQTLARAGYDPKGMPDFFERLYQNTRLYGRQIPEFLSTHPVTTNRIAESTARAEQYGGKGRRDTLSFRLARTKLQVALAAPDQRAEMLTDYRRRQGKLAEHERYGMALALRETGDLKQAGSVMAQLLKENPDRLTYLLNLANIELDSKQTDPALARYREALDYYPGNATVIQFYALALLQLDRPGEAYEILQRVLQEDPREPELYRLYAEAAGNIGRRWESHEATAEYYYLNGDTRAAIDQLSLALKNPDLSYYDNARISARLKAFKDELAMEVQL